ncbi:DNA repair protein RecN [Croceivirga sp. JEA036]|uniref:DNA repair protein RecN n=1 Tax=Croceivirga sp. JEA036 TaxID=2721162 RepID=UPI001438D046|nr:DNA repair protein RecN [Croceivirga sp. JEA036]NJB35866.1 DNA repair protein RecN [Croceivirga sp. JEA036]
MLTQLTIKNYALIDDLNVGFESGFTTITGETGAGKSILLGALSLVLGKRADLSALKNQDKKCTIEGTFAIKAYQLEGFFKENDLDYEEDSILRREILPSGKSRAFINDTPVTLGVLSSLGELLVDIHSQHQTMQLTENAFQFKVVDALAGNQAELLKYRKELNEYRKLVKAYQELLQYQTEASKELEYNTFLLEELQAAPLKEGKLAELEEEYEQLSNVEQVQEWLAQAHQVLNDEQIGMVNTAAGLQQALQKLATFGQQYGVLNNRVQSVAIELADLASEIEKLNDTIDADPERLEIVNGQMQQLHTLLKKHQVSSEEELLALKKDLEEKVDVSLNMDQKIAANAKAVKEQESILNTICASLHQNRKKSIPILANTLQEKIASLGMPAATFKIEIVPAADFKSNGKDELVFLLSSNKGSAYGELKKVASGGELSRIMLAIKSILASYEKLPTLMFDEIDTGVSGEISNRMGEIMKEMGAYMQVFSITHLPQVAAKGKQQYKVFKQEVGDTTTTQMKRLEEEQRIEELAEMLGGKQFSSSAMEHAKELLANA